MMSPPSQWRTPEGPFQLLPGDVHVWRLRLDLPLGQVHELREVLSADERQRAGRFVCNKHRNRFIACRGQARQVLASYLGAAAGELQFRYGPRGKPALAAPWGESLTFNISHSHDLALCAVARGRELGVDIEHIRPPSDFDGLAAHFFAPGEVAALRSVPEEIRLESFFRCWTRKEAVLKAVGSGLALPLDRIVVTLGPDEPAQLLACDEDPGGPADWELFHLEPGPGYVGALAARGGPMNVLCYEHIPRPNDNRIMNDECE
jgi:4'-phosphopantetheinyl transferase